MNRLGLELRRARKPLAWVILLYALAAAAGLAMLARQEFISPFTSHEFVQVALENAAGVVAGKTEVRVAGVEVGLVQSVKLVDEKPRLTLAVNPEVGPIHTDAQARLAAVTPLQDMYVELDPGTRASGALKPAIIPSSQTSAAVDIADVLDAFNADQRQRLTTLLDQLSRGLPDGGIRLQQAFAQLVPLMQDGVEITQQIDGEHRELADVVHNLGQVTGVLAGHDRELAKLVTSAAGTLNTLAVNDRPLDATLRALPPTVAALHSGLADVAASIGAINPALHELRPAARALAPALTALTGFANQARPALSALSPAADALVPLSATLERFAGAAQRATSSLTPETAAIDGLTATTERCLGALAAFVDRFMSANKLGNSKGTWWRVQIVLNADAGTPINSCANGSPNR